jgi:glutamate racemase
MSDHRPIGVFDSGVGGLTVVGQLTEILPKEKIVYFGDTARVPYGTKSKETVTKFSVENVEFLMKHDVKMIVVACNTVSSLSLDFLKRCFRVPIIGVIEPGAKGALGATRNNRVGVIGTSATISSCAYEKTIKKLNPRISVYSRNCTLFVPLVEDGWLDSSVTRQVAKEYLEPLKKKRIDTLILGCTHYPLLKNILSKVMGPDVILIDSAREVAKCAKEVLDANGLLNNSGAKPKHEFFVSDEPDRFARTGERFLKKKMGSVRKARCTR